MEYTAKINHQKARLSGYTKLQGLILPDISLCDHEEMYIRRSCGVEILDSGKLQFKPSSQITLDTYFNLFNLGKWVRHCGLNDLSLVLFGSGLYQVVVFGVGDANEHRVLISEKIDLGGDHDPIIDLTGLIPIMEQGVLYVRLTALTNGGSIDAIDWQTRQAKRSEPELLIGITTFKREQAVEKSVSSFQRFIDSSWLKPHVQLIVVDNGKSVRISNTTNVTILENENLGGAGGFARCLLEARKRGVSHALFMDDDAHVHMQAIERTWVFLAFANDSKTAVVGALATAKHDWELWENGAVYDRVCTPLHLGVDLRDAEQVIGMEWATTARPPDNYYGGWWYFAFPVAQAVHMPVPFFVRGDDISFGLANDFNMVTLPGVISFQDDDFSDKESPLTLYLDLRSHLAHHLTFDSLDIGAVRTWFITLRFMARALIGCHYETMAALNQAIEDALQGPDFYRRNPDMVERRRDIAALRDREVYRDIELPVPVSRAWINPERWFDRMVMKATINGHLIPFFSKFANRVTLTAHQRGHIRPLWGAGQITYVSRSGDQSYCVTHSKAEALRQCWRYARASILFLVRYRKLRAEWGEEYGKITSQEFWRGALDVEL